MTPEELVIDLKHEVRSSVAETIQYVSSPPSRRPPEHLAILSQWYNGLSEQDRTGAQLAMEYAAERTLFMLLSIFDGVMDTPSSFGGEFELYHSKHGVRVRLNNHEHGNLYDIFNNTP